MAKPKTVQAVATRPVFINDVLHQPGEIVAVNLAALGVTSLDAKNMTALDPVKGGMEEPLFVPAPTVPVRVEGQPAILSS
jgi:hypothetical protein